MPNSVKNVAFTAPTDYEVEAQDILRQRKMAEALRAQGMTPMGDTQMIGGWAIPRSPMEGLAKALQQGVGTYQEQQLNERQKALAEAMRTERQGTVSQAMGAMQGTPGQAEIPMPSDELGGGPGAPAQAAMAADPKRAYQILAGSQFPDLQSMGMSNLLKQEADYTLKPGETRFRGTAPIANLPNKVDPFSLSPGQTRYDAQGNILVAAPDKPEKDEAAKFNAILTGAGIDPASPQGQALFKALAMKTATHQPAANQQVNVSTDKSYFGHVAQGLATQDVAAIDVARSAPQRIESAQRVKEFLDKNPITGAFAEKRLYVEKGLATAGLIDGSRVKTTEDLASNLASQTLDAIKTSGLGSGQGFTDKDRAFLERAKSGNIEINAGTLRQLADLNEKSARAGLKRGNEIITKLKGNKEMGQVGVGLDLVPEPSSGSSPEVESLLKKYGRPR